MWNWNWNWLKLIDWPLYKECKSTFTQGLGKTNRKYINFLSIVVATSRNITWQVSREARFWLTSGQTASIQGHCVQAPSTHLHSLVSRLSVGGERESLVHTAHAFNLPKIWGLRGIFWFFRVMWRQSSDSIMYTYQDITMACNESSDCSTATDLLNFVRSIITVSKLCLHFAHLRFSKPSSSFNVISYRALILDASLSWLAFQVYQTMLVYGGYEPQRIHKGGTPMPFSLTGPRRDVYYWNFVRTHAPKQCKGHKREQRHF